MGLGFLDGFPEFCLPAGVVSACAGFPDCRARHSIPMFFFCHTLVHRPLWYLSRLQPLQDTPFRSPYILRQLGFSARQIDASFCRMRKARIRSPLGRLRMRLPGRSPRTT